MDIQIQEHINKSDVHNQNNKNYRNNENSNIVINKKLNNSLKNKYTLWFHNANNNNWSIDSYKQILTFTNINEIIKFNNEISKYNQLITNGMFFIMKKDIKPMWEDSQNINGGCISWKINKVDVLDNWVNFVELLFTNELDVFDNYKLNGISVSPKRNNSILKIWLGKNISDEQLEILCNLSENCIFKNTSKLFKKHQDNINQDSKSKK